MAQHTTLSVFEHQQKKLCDLYDSHAPSDGDAQDIRITLEQSGWKE